MSLLRDLLTKYDTDNRIWGHAPAYEKHLDRERVGRMLEIGIDAPHSVVASMRAWRDYFPNADIYGINNDARFIYKDDRIETARCDAYDEQQLAETIKSWRTPLFDFIRDNAVHDPLPQLHLCRMLWSVLAPGGVYAIEEACPYKCPENSLEPMVELLTAMHPDMHATEYPTHKDERLLILQKALP